MIHPRAIPPPDDPCTEYDCWEAPPRYSLANVVYKPHKPFTWNNTAIFLLIGIVATALCLIWGERH